MTPEELQHSLQHNLAKLPGTAAVRATREAAMNAFATAGYPTRGHEDWRYTDLKPLADADLVLFPQPPEPLPSPAAAALMATVGLPPDAYALLFVDGYLAANQVSARLGDGIELSSLADSLEQIGPVTSVDDVNGQPLAALNLAFAREGARLTLDRGKSLEAPIHLIFANVSPLLQASQPQFLIQLAPNARAQVIVHHIGTAESASWTNMLTRVVLEAGAHLTLHRLQDHGPKQLHTELLDAKLAADSELELTSLDFGGRLVRNDIHVNLTAPGARCDLAGLTLASDGQHIDNHIRIDHVGSHTESEQSFRNIVGDHGRAVFNGKVIVHRNTKGIAANQASDNLLLAANGEIDTKPELEIYADDVKCSHGATVGELDEQQLFYLRSRGIGDSAARGLLTLAFATQILERTTAPTRLNARVIAKLGLDLPEDPTWRPTP